MSNNTKIHTNDGADGGSTRTYESGAVKNMKSGSIQNVKSGASLILDSGSKFTRAIETITDDRTVLAAESGKTFLIATDAKAFTLPPTAAGLRYSFINSGADGASIVTISPQAADAIQGGGLAGVDDSDLINTKASAKQGDMVTLVGDGISGWWIESIVGTWAKG